MTAVAFNGTAHLFVTSVILGIIILSTVVGNVFVLLAIILERNLHNVANYLIASLAVADLMVATLVMPLAAVKEMSTRWFLGQEACDAFTSFDVLCCTASILHLVSISLDRYWAVSRVDYIRNRSARRILVMIAASWGISAVISIPPLFGWRHQTASDPVTVTPVDGSSDGVWSGNDTGVNVTDGTIVSRTFVQTDNVNDVDDCLISQDWGYTVFSTLGAFYIPLFFMLIVYARIYQLARARIRKKLFAKREAAASSSTQGDNSRKKNARTHDTNGRTTVKADLTIATLTDNATTFATTVERRRPVRRPGNKSDGNDDDDNVDCIASDSARFAVERQAIAEAGHDVIGRRRRLRRALRRRQRAARQRLPEAVTRARID
jgi:5-hydroxytryptamine receptor 1